MAQVQRVQLVVGHLAIAVETGRVVPVARVQSQDMAVVLVHGKLPLIGLVAVAVAELQPS